MKKESKRRLLLWLENGLTLLLGSVLYSLGYVALIAPHALVLGGATGVATVFFSLWRLPVGVGVFLLNLPLILWSCFVGGWRTTFRALKGIVFTSAFLSLFEGITPPSFSPLLGALLGGAVTGAGIGLLLTADYTTGGSELAASLLLHRRRRHFTLGRLVMLFDSAIVLVATAVLGTPEALPYSITLNLAFALSLDLFMRIGERLPYPISHQF